ncbi:protein kinase [Trypanosoma conorhini]|uniref:Protein kinase n=1 Tax=Trypanosoma conorhini TaxID=83891 RepID=A0A422P3L9_9TRYP|nr:protein kinase [Trypanosoma conorhini]RNF12321.1 protein kinase [Trypanosoma conorhini]
MGSCGSISHANYMERGEGISSGAERGNGAAFSRQAELDVDLPFADHNPGAKMALFHSQLKSKKRSSSALAMQRVLGDHGSKMKKINNDKFWGSFTVPPRRGSTGEWKKASCGVRRRMSSIMNGLGNPMNNLLCKNENEDMEGHLQRIFALLDTQGKHKVSEEALLQRLGAQFSKQSMKAMFAVADGDKDGYLNWNEFSNFFRYIAGTGCVFAESADVYSALESKLNLREAAAKVSFWRHQDLYDVRIVNLPSQAGRIQCIAMAPGLALYAVSHLDTSVAHVYKLNGVEVLHLTGHSEFLLGIAFSPDKKYLATASQDWALNLWDSTVGQVITCVQHEGVVTAVAFSYNSRVLYTGCQDNAVRRLTVPEGGLNAVLKELPNRQDGAIVALATQHTRDEWVVFSRSCDECACLADAQRLSTVRRLYGHEGVVWHARFSPDDSLILTGCGSRLNIWDANSGTLVITFDSKRVINSRSGGCFTSAVFFPMEFGNMLIVFTSLRQFYIMRIETGDIVLDMTLRAPVYATASDFAGRSLVCGDVYGNVYNIQLCC